MEIVHVVKNPAPRVSDFSPRCLEFGSLLEVILKLGLLCCAWGVFTRPLLFLSSFLSQSFIHVNVLGTREEGEAKKSWGEIQLDTDINHSVCISKYLT